MNYKFDITLTDSDYLDFNMFQATRSHYGKKQIKSVRMFLTIITAVYLLVVLVGGGFSKESILHSIPTTVVLIAMQLFVNKFYLWILKSSIKNLKKTGKMGYSPKAVMEFYDDTFVEITPDEKTERKYSAIERISVVENKVVYIHTNNVMAYILPMNCFDSLEQYYFFMSFIKTKCPTIDSYK